MKDKREEFNVYEMGNFLISIQGFLEHIYQEFTWPASVRVS